MVGGKMNELTIIKNDQAVTSSLIVAEQFGKRHDHVLRDIDDIKGLPKIGETYFRKKPISTHKISKSTGCTT